MGAILFDLVLTGYYSKIVTISIFIKIFSQKKIIENVEKLVKMHYFKFHYLEFYIKWGTCFLPTALLACVSLISEGFSKTGAQ